MMLGVMRTFIVVLGLLASDCSLVSAALELQITVRVGETVTLPCTTTLKTWVDWRYHRSPFDDPPYVYSNGVMYSGMSSRLNVMHPTQEDFSLTIKNAEPNDTGLYTCIEDGGNGNKHTISLLVTNSTPTPPPPLPMPDESNYGALAIVLLVFVILLVIAVVILAIFLYRQCKKGLRPVGKQLQPAANTHFDGEELNATCEPLIVQQPVLAAAPNDVLDQPRAATPVPPPPTPAREDKAVDKGPPSFTHHNVSTEPGNEVRGVCVLDVLVYVARSPQSSIDIYDAKTLKKLDDKLPLNEDHPCCMALCSTEKCLYITYYRSQNIQKISVDGKQRKQWRINSQPDGISVAPSTHVVVALREAHQLVEFNSDGQELSRIDLQQRSPRHPLPFGNDCYLVCFGVISQSPCEVHLIDKSGRSLNKVTTGTQHPLHLAVDSRGYVYVADFSANHVTMLDKDLKYLGEVIAAHETKVDVPFRLCFNEKCDRLYVGEYGGQRRVMAFDIN